MNDLAETGAAAAGTSIVRADLVGTAVFLAVGALGSIVESTRSATIAVSVALFAAGIATFIWSFFAAAERSRESEIGVANLYLLTGPTAPPRVKRAMVGCLIAQTVGCLVFASVGFAGLEVGDSNPLAFAILAPMFGLGLDGLWASRHGAFGPRIVSAPAKRRRAVPPPDHDLEKNAPHG